MGTMISTSNVISSVPALQNFLSAIPASSTLYLGLEGNNLSRNETISLITLIIHSKRVIGLIDVVTLGSLSFTTAAANGQTLKSILEDPTVPKCFWDVRNSADALWVLYGIDLAGVTDIQLLENASQPGDRKFVHGLDKCLQRDLKLGFMELHRWLKIKKEIQKLIPTNIFAARPMAARTVEYCVDDVIHLPDLHDLYVSCLPGDWLLRVKEETTRRIAEARSSGYDPQSSSNNLGPWGSETRQYPGTLDGLEERLEELSMEKRACHIFGNDDEVGYYDDDDDGCTNAADGGRGGGLLAMNGTVAGIYLYNI